MVMASDGAPVPLLEYLRLLKEAQEVSYHAVERLRSLKSRAPDVVPADYLEGLAPRPGDRRGAPRVRPWRTEAAQLSEDGQQEWRAWVLDRTWGGLAVLSERPRPVGAVLWLREPDGGGPAQPVEVRHCRPCHGYWVLGCAVSRVPT